MNRISFAILLGLLLAACESSREFGVVDVDETTFARYEKLEVRSNYAYVGDKEQEAIDLATNEFAGEKKLVEVGNQWDRSTKYAFAVGGPILYGMPEGIHTYRGRNLVKFGESEGTGNFELVVDFDGGTGNLNGTADLETTGSSASGITTEVSFNDLQLNLEQGNFSGDGVFTTTNSGVESNRDVAISGMFHGENATGVSGLYREDGSSSEVIGRVLGVRVEED